MARSAGISRRNQRITTIHEAQRSPSSSGRQPVLEHHPTDDRVGERSTLPASALTTAPGPGQRPRSAQQTVPGQANAWEPVSGIEPLTCRLQEVRPLAASALAAPMAQVIALTAPAALGSFRAPFHETFHADDRKWPITVTECRCCGLPHS
jgi:hypothetical protein